jgi:phosphoglycerate dehydrogenase-like enzyme
MKSGWGGTPALTLFDRPVATHGLGAIAQEFVKLLQPFRCPVAAYSPSVPDSVFAELGVRRVHTLAELYAEHDVVVCHAGSTPKTHHIVNRDILTRLPDGALFVNTARGEVVDSDALIAELKKNRIWAALDVFEGEPLAVDSPLRGLPNCLLMPHTGGPTADWLWRMGQTAADNVARYVRGLEPKNLITLAVFDRST